MEKPSDTDSSEILGDWDLYPPVNSEERIIMVSVPTSPESEDARSNPPKNIETRVSDKERGSTSTVAGEEAARRVLPPWVNPSNERGGGKWKEDGRKKKKKEKESEEIIPFKEIIEALVRNSGEKVEEEEEEEEKGKSQSCVDMLKSMGFNFPL